MVAMAGLIGTVLWTIGISGVFALSIVELRKRKIKRDSDEKSLATGSSQSDDAISDDAEVDTRPKPKRKKEDVESSNTTNKSRKSSADSGPHNCRFCGAQFKLSQALGGHMNRHRLEKDKEAMNKAEELLAKNQQFMVGNPWTMQGGGGGVGGNPYYGGPALLPNPPGPGLGTSSRPFYNLPNQSASTLQNSQFNHLAAQQNAQVAIHSLQGGGYYNPMDNTRTHYATPSQRNVIPPGQFQGLRTPGVNIAVNLGQHPVQTVYSDSKGTVLHSGTDHNMQPHGQSVFHFNQGGLSDTVQDILNMPTLPNNRNQQAQSNVSLVSDSFIRQAAHERQMNNMQFVDQHGNPVTDFQTGHSSQMPQDYTQTSLHQKPCTSVGSLRNESAGIKIEHGQAPGHLVFQSMPSLEAGQDFQGGTDQSTKLMESGQAGFETDTSVDHHTSGRLQ